MRKLTLLLLGWMPLYIMAQAPAVQKTSTGYYLKWTEPNAQGVQSMTVDFIAPAIVKVNAQPFQEVIPVTSLMVVEQVFKNPELTFNDKGNDWVSVQSNVLEVRIDKKNGLIQYYDAKGNLLLKEHAKEARRFQETYLNGSPVYKIQQNFDISKNEAWYGLGQHQTGSFNYNGEQVELLQYNTVASVPFMVSQKNYGILWDNNSYTLVGDVRPKLSLDALKLFDKDGKQGWLTATYYNKKNPADIWLVRPESDLNYSSLDDQVKFPASFKLNDANAKWEGSFVSAQTGKHLFWIRYSGYLKVYINDSLVADRWRQAWNAGVIQLNYPVEKEKSYRIRLEWDPDGGEAYLEAKVLPPSLQKTTPLSFASDVAHHLQYYFVAGNNIDEVISGYRMLTGKAVLLPKSAYGFWQSRERYKTQKELLDVVAQFRNDKVGIDQIVQDWSYWPEKEWGSQNFDLQRFPDAKAMVDKVHEQHVKILISVWPKIYEHTDVFKTFREKGFLYERNVAEQRLDWIGKGYTSTFYDVFNKDARKAFWELAKERLHSKGFDGWWLDAVEPDIHSNLSRQQRIDFMSPTALGAGAAYFNAYPLLASKGFYEGLMETDPDKRVLILTRASFGGLQRYGSITWSGDIASRWDDFKDQIAAGMNFSMSGQPNWTSDIGGFSVESRYYNPTASDLEEWRELNTRWYQFGAFCPIFRVHGQFPFREYYNIAPKDHTAYASMLYYNRLRYRLIPYIYSLAGATYHQDYTLMRSLIMDFPHDRQVASVNDQFLLGSALLVNPVYKYQSRSREVYLPGGSDWYDFYTGEKYSGSQTIIIDAPYEKIPVLVKSGSIIPMGEVQQYVDEKKDQTIQLLVYQGADGKFDLYEDDGASLAYTKGNYSIIPLRYDESSKTLTIGARKGSYKGMISNRNFEVVVIGTGSKQGFDSKMKVTKKVKYSGKLINIQLR